jgi:hypothetical protein
MNTVQLRNMSAEVNHNHIIELEDLTGNRFTVTDAFTLTSYVSLVAVYGYDARSEKYRVFLLPRYDYSVTTWKHLHAFIQDYCACGMDVNANIMRKRASLGCSYEEYEYEFVNGIVYGGRTYDY